MRDLLAVVAVLADSRVALVAAEDVLLRHDDEARGRHLEAREQGPAADVNGIVMERLCCALDERRDAAVREELTQAVRLLPIAEQHEHALLLREPAIGLVLQEVHLAAERRHRRCRHANRLNGHSARHLLQEECQVDDAVGARGFQEFLPAEDLALDVRVLAHHRADRVADARRLIKEDSPLPLEVREEEFRPARIVRLCQRHDGRRADVLGRALRVEVEFTQRVDLVVEVLDAHRLSRIDGKDVDDAAAHAELSDALDLLRVLVAKVDEALQEVLARQDVAHAQREREPHEFIAAHALLHGCFRAREHDDMLAAHEAAEHLHAPGGPLLALGRRLDVKRIDLRQFDDGDLREQQPEVLLPIGERLRRVADDGHHLRH